MTEKNEPDQTKPDTSPLVEPENALPSVTLDELPQTIQDAARRAGWDGLMPVQQHAIPYMLKKRNLMVQSRTGSGKTGAFVLPLLEQLDSSRAECQALVLVPTRELAKQVGDEAIRLFGDSGMRVISVYGGVGYGAQIDAFKKGAHLVVGTPGRILDHLLKGTLSLDRLRVLIFDEADRMLSMGFYPDMREVQKYLPNREINGYMFSATFPPSVVRLASRFLRDPQMLSLSKDVVHVPTTAQTYYLVPGMEKDRILARLIEMENPDSAIIFCNTKDQVRFVVTVLQRLGFDAHEMTADLKQTRREKLLDLMRKGNLRFLVATDLAARGLDIPEISHVVQYEPPEDPEAYIHRAGRTGRAGATGTAITLVSPQERPEINRIAKRFNIDMQEKTPPTTEDVEKVVAERTTVLLESKLRNRDRLQRERMDRFLPLAKALAESEEERSLIAMLLDDFYQQSLHATDQPPPEPPSQKKERHSGGDRGGGGQRQRRPGGRGRGRGSR